MPARAHAAVAQQERPLSKHLWVLQVARLVLKAPTRLPVRACARAVLPGPINLSWAQRTASIARRARFKKPRDRLLACSVAQASFNQVLVILRSARLVVSSVSIQPRGLQGALHVQ